MSIPVATLPDCVLRESAKTLKIKLRKSAPLGKAVEDMNDWLWKQQAYSRVQFKYGDSYIVIAKLEEKEEEE